MLILAKEYIDEHGGDGTRADLCGQEANGTVWSIAKMNMLLHGISTADLRNDDTLAEPQHTVEGGELMRFDRVLSNPPFSINWGTTDTDRRQWPLGAQVPRALPLRPGAAGQQEGRPDVPAAHGGGDARRRHGCHRDAARRAVPRRRGTRHPRRMIEADLLEAVIGLPANLFYGTGIPACMLVLRQRQGNRSGKPAERQGKVLFINADREYFEGRAQNHLLPEHIEKIVNTFETFAEPCRLSAPSCPTPRCARTTATSTSAATPTTRRRPSRTTCARTCWAACPRPRCRPRRHCSPRMAWTRWRYSSSAMPATSTSAPSWPRARPSSPRSRRTPALWRASRRCAMPLMPGGRRTARASQPWPERPASLACATSCCTAFSAALEPAGVLGRFQVRGIVAGFWDDAKYEFMTLMARGAKGVVDAWRTSILTALDDEQSKDNPLDHKLVKFLMAGFVEALAELETRKAELDSQIKAATPDRGAGEDGDEAEAGDDEPAVDEAQLKEWKKQLATLKKDIKAQEQGFAKRLDSAVDALDEAGAAALLLAILRNDMQVILERYIGAQRQQVIAAFENWWDKYRVTLTDVERDRDVAAAALRGFVNGLGYV
jgi:type I restriction enzyme M protein